MRNVGGGKYQQLDMGTILFLEEAPLHLLFSFLLPNYSAYYCSESKPIVYTHMQSTVSFRSV